MPLQPSQGADATAKLMLVGISLAWGLTWPAMRVALDEVPPFSMRLVTLSLGAGALFLIAKLQGRALTLGGNWNALHLFVSSTLNVLPFSLLSVIAMMYAPTGRVAMLAYTMPIWSAVFAWMFLGERLIGMRLIGLTLCVAGMAILIYPLAHHGIPVGLLIALSIAVLWAAGIIYVKRVRITGDPIGNAAWQIFFSLAVVAVFEPFFEGWPQLSQASGLAWFGMIFAGLAGSALAYVLWFAVVERVPAMTASLGVLATPVIGVISTAILLGERPTHADIVGYVLILAASACAMLPAPKA